MTHWFLSFLWKGPGDTTWRPYDAAVRGEHPLAYLKRVRAAYPSNEYRLMFFHEIPEEIFILHRT